jgi:hypothetical protein
MDKFNSTEPQNKICILFIGTGGSVCIGFILLLYSLLNVPILEAQCIQYSNITLEMEIEYNLKELNKIELFEICYNNKPIPKYVVWENMKECNKINNTDLKLLMLPVAHPELNPIELMWSGIKKHVRNNNKTFNMKDIKPLAEDYRDIQDRKNHWMKCYKHMGIILRSFIPTEEQ